MQYGAMNSPIKPVLKELEAIAALGFDYLELTMDAPQAHYAIVRENKQRIFRALRRHGMGCVCHLPTFVYTADLTDGIREASLNEVLRSLEVAADLDPLKVVIHPSIISGLGFLVKETAVQKAYDSLRVVYQRARQLGMHLCLENMFPRLAYMVEPDEFGDLLASFPSMKMTLDVGHAHIGATDGSRGVAFIRRLKDRIGHVHLSDNLGQRDDHLPIGSGTVDFEKIARELKEIGYDDTVTLEVFSNRRLDLVTSKDRFAALYSGR